jgi:hypothetical protein
MGRREKAKGKMGGWKDERRTREGVKKLRG